MKYFFRSTNSVPTACSSDSNCYVTAAAAVEEDDHNIHQPESNAVSNYNGGTLSSSHSKSLNP